MRIDRNIKERGHDPYIKDRKHAEGAYCPECHAVCQGGRWVWSKGPITEGEPVLCSACRRIRDDFPAGELYLSGKYLIKHRNEIENLIHKITREARERSPLKRMMDIKQDRNGLCVRFTDDHLARQTGDAVYHAYKGDLKLKYADEQKFVRLFWHRDE